MNAHGNDLAWEDKLRAAVLAVYLDFGAPARFYIQDCVPFKLLEYLEPGMTKKFGDIALYVNAGADERLNLANRDFVLFTTNGIVAYGADAANFRAWDKLAQYHADNLPQNADMAARQTLCAEIAAKIAPSLVAKCPGVKETLSALLTRALRALLALEPLPPERLPDWLRPFAPPPGQLDHPAAATLQPGRPLPNKLAPRALPMLDHAQVCRP